MSTMSHLVVLTLETLAYTLGNGCCLIIEPMITGSQSQYNEIRMAIVTHSMQFNSDLLS